MRVLVSGTGRSGTCLLIEVVRGLNVVQVTKKVEDRLFFEHNKLPKNYGTKLVTDNPAFTLESITEMMEKYPDLRVILSTRHPVDVFMSKIYRGQKPSKGGDGKYERISADGTPWTAVAAILKFYTIYVNLCAMYPGRVIAIKLEDLILHARREVRGIAQFLGKSPTPRALDFYKNDRNKYHKNRYNGKLDTSQINIHERWDTVFDGYFKDRGIDVIGSFGNLASIITGLGYLGYKT